MILKKYLKDFIKFSRNKLILSVILTFLLNTFNGITLLLIIPLLSVSGLISKNSDKFSRATEYIFNILNIPLNLYSVLTVYILLVGIFAYLKKYLQVLNTSVQNLYTAEKNIKLFKKITEADWLFLKDKTLSSVAQSVSSDIQKVGSGTFSLFQLVSSIFTIIFHIAAAMVISPLITLLSVILLALVSLIITPLHKSAYSRGKFSRKSKEKLLFQTTEFMKNIKLTKSMNAGTQHTERFKKISSDLAEYITAFSEIRNRATMIYQLSGVISISLFLIAGIKIFETPTHELFVLIYIFSRLLPQFSQFFTNYSRVKNMLPSFESIENLVHELDINREEENLSGEIINDINRIKFKNVVFRYKNKAKISKEIRADFLIEKGALTCIYGTSGSGKTTCADLMTGLIKDYKGEISFNDIPAHKLNIRELRNRISYIPQENFLFTDTLRNNLAPGACKRDEEIFNSLKTADAADFTSELKSGLDHECINSGAEFSGGQKQRLAVARGLLRDPQILILDETLNSVDKESKAKIINNLKEKKSERITIIISHDKYIRDRADAVIEI